MLENDERRSQFCVDFLIFFVVINIIRKSELSVLYYFTKCIVFNPQRGSRPPKSLKQRFQRVLGTIRSSAPTFNSGYKWLSHIPSSSQEVSSLNAFHSRSFIHPYQIECTCSLVEL